MNEQRLPEGVEVAETVFGPKQSGALHEVYRESACGGKTAKQWNVITNYRGWLSGMHIHPYDEWYVVLSGRVLLGY